MFTLISEMVHRNNSIIESLDKFHYIVCSSDGELELYECDMNSENSKLIVSNYDTQQVYIEYIQHCAMLFCDL